MRYGILLFSCFHYPSSLNYIAMYPDHTVQILTEAFLFNTADVFREAGIFTISITIGFATHFVTDKNTQNGYTSISRVFGYCPDYVLILALP